MKKKTYAVFACCLVLGSAIKFYLIGPGSIMVWLDKTEVSQAYLPRLQGTNLLGDVISFPQDLQTPLTLLVIGFKRNQQPDIDTWIQAYHSANFSPQQVGFFELPIIYETNSLKRFLINNGMKIGIPDSQQRQRTVTIYMNRQKLFESLQMSPEAIYALLVTQQGKIIWRSQGKASGDQIQSLRKRIHHHAAS